MTSLLPPSWSPRRYRRLIIFFAYRLIGLITCVCVEQNGQTTSRLPLTPPLEDTMVGVAWLPLSVFNLVPCLLFGLFVLWIFGLQDGDDDLAASSIPLEDIMVGEEYEGVINNVVSYGAFVDIGTEVTTTC